MGIQFMFFPLTGAAILMWISAGLNTSCREMPVPFARALFLLMHFTEVQAQVSVLPNVMPWHRYSKGFPKLGFDDV